MNNIRKQILDEFAQHHYVDFWKHKDLVAMCVCGAYIADENECDFEEVVFVLEKEWLLTRLKKEEQFEDFDSEKLQKWLQDTYTSGDSEWIFNEAMKANKIVMVDFN